ncbi:MAG TPA: DUF2490 domain-containing protein, partial [Chitinophagaceae bacterium]|nr:DUF2490 domain-containing protein [Chitinophagaceae bacterium]
MKKILIAILTISISSGSIAQTKQTVRAEQLWTGFFNQTRVGSKWGLWLDAQLRTEDDFFKDLTVSIIRPGITYYVNDALKLTA